jgi:hypothetical protein
MSQAAALPDVIRDIERVSADIVDRGRQFPPRSWPTWPAAAAR